MGRYGKKDCLYIGLLSEGHRYVYNFRFLLMETLPDITEYTDIFELNTMFSP